jgi:hypothetical protein
LVCRGRQLEHPATLRLSDRQNPSLKASLQSCVERCGHRAGEQQVGFERLQNILSELPDYLRSRVIWRNQRLDLISGGDLEQLQHTRETAPLDAAGLE